MSSTNETVHRLEEKLETLRREKTNLITAISSLIDPILTNGEALLHADENNGDSLQSSISAVDACIDTCTGVHRRLNSRQNEPWASATAPEPPPSPSAPESFTEPPQSYSASESFREPPPSYYEVISKHLQLDDRNPRQENPRAVQPSWDSASMRSSCHFLAKFKPWGRPLPEGTYLSVKEKQRPLSSYYGSWELLASGGWNLDRDFCCFVPPMPGLYYVTLEWRQCGEGTLSVALGNVNRRSAVDLYHKAGGALTSSSGDYGRLIELVDLQDDQPGLWVSMLRYGKYSAVDYLFVMSDLAHSSQQ